MTSKESDMIDALSRFGGQEDIDEKRFEELERLWADYKAGKPVASLQCERLIRIYREWREGYRVLEGSRAQPANGWYADGSDPKVPANKTGAHWWDPRTFIDNWGQHHHTIKKAG